MKHPKVKNLIISVGLSHFKTKSGGKEITKVFYTYNIIDIEGKRQEQSMPAIATEKGFKRNKLEILTEILENKIPLYIAKFKGTVRLKVHYVVNDNELGYIWDEINEENSNYNFSKELNGDYWQRIYLFCKENRIELFFSDEKSVLSPLSKGQIQLLRNLGERDEK